MVVGGFYFLSFEIFNMKSAKFIAGSFCLIVVFYALYVSTTNKKNSLEGEVIQPTVAKQLATPSLSSLLQIDDLVERERQLKSYFSSRLKKDPKAVLGLIARLNNRTDRELSYQVALLVWHRENIGALTNWLNTQAPTQDLDPALLALIELGLTYSSKLEFILLCTERLFDPDSQNEAISRLLTVWAVAEAERIILWSLTQDHERDKWLMQVFQRLTTNSLSDAITSLSLLQHGTPQQLRLAIQTIIDFYQVNTVDEQTLVAMQTLIPYSIREEIIGALLPLLVQENGLTLDNLVSLINSLESGDAKNSYREQLALNWAIKDPKEAAEYAASLSGEARTLAVNGVVSTWMQADLESTDQWLKTLDGDIDLAASTLGRGSANLGNVQIADEWINHIKDEQLRTEAIIDVINGYYQDSPEAGIYHLVYQKSLTTQQKLDLLHQKYPGEVFISPMEALDELGRLENLKLGY